MATVEERVSYLEGQVVLLPQMIGQIGERIDRVEVRIDRLDARLDSLGARLDGFEGKMSKQFFWLIGIQMTTFVTTLATILGVFYSRG